MQNLLEIFSRSNPKMVEELVPGMLTMGELLRVIRNLLKEEISIRDLRTILEALLDLAGQTKNPEVLTELVRQRLARNITEKYRSPDQILYAITIDPGLEETMRSHQEYVDDDIHLTIKPDIAQRFIKALQEQAERAEMLPHPPVLLVPAELRRGVYNLIKAFIPDLPVLSHKEIDSTVQIELAARVGV